MDLVAYSQIKNLAYIMKSNNIVVPRLRGLGLMKDEEPWPRKELLVKAEYQGLYECVHACRSRFIMNACWAEYSAHTDAVAEKYIEFERDEDGVDHLSPVAIKWDKGHGRKRKVFKYVIKQAKKRVLKQFEVWNKYCGRDDVLYIHARIGGENWDTYRDEVETQPWFLEKVDDAFDSTYCDIFAKIGDVYERRMK